MHISFKVLFGEANKPTKKQTTKNIKCVSDRIQSRVVCVLHFYIFGLYDLECIFMAIGLGYRHQHRGNFVYRKFGRKKSDSPTKKQQSFLLLFVFIFYYSGVLSSSHALSLL